MSGRAKNEDDPEKATGYGTAARTRPMSIQDIMLQREKKAASEAKKAKDGIKDNDKGKTNNQEPERGHRSRKGHKDTAAADTRDTSKEHLKKDDLRHTPREGHKKESTRDTPKEVSKKDSLKDRPNNGSRMDGLKDMSKIPRKDDQKDSSKKGSKKEKSPIRDDNHSVQKNKDTHSSHKQGTIMVGQSDKSKDGNHADIRARNGDATRSEYLKGPGKRWNDETTDNDRSKERSKKLQNETKRKRRDFDDEKSLEGDRLVPTKHNLSRFQDYKQFDRNSGRKEYAKPYLEENRSKRRRSRSRDYDRGQVSRGRSNSLSPREQRYTYRGHDYDNHPPYHSMDKSRRKYTETDRHRTSGNDGYSGGSYRKYGSRLGGYSPRKRKTAPKDEQATTKTSSPVFQSPEKKSALWDQPPAAAAQSSFFTKLQTTVGQIASSVPISFTASKQNPATTLETILAGKSSSVDSVQLTQATRPLRRLHIENLPSSATEDTLIGCLNNFLLSSGINHIQRSKQPCLSCTINKEKRQAFVEFLTPEDATEALSFDGRSFNGSALKIRRPKEYVEMANVAPKKPAEDSTLISDVVVDSPHKILIAGISAVISSEMLMEIVGAFGQLAAYRFIFNEDLGERCAFLEYIDHSVTSKACAGLNGMKLGGRIITAVQVFPDPPKEVGREAFPFYGIPDSAKSLLEEPTEVLQLKNVFDREECLLLSKSEVEEILEDVRLECARFGAVRSVNLVEYPDSSDNNIDDTLVKPEDGSVNIEPTKHSAGDDFTTEPGIECSAPNQSRDVTDHSDPTETKDANPTSDSQDHKEPDTHSECNVPASADKHTHLDDIHARADVPTLDQHAEADLMESMEADHQDTAADDGTPEKGHLGPKTSETCSTAHGDAEKSEGEDEQQGDNDLGESSAEKVPIADTRDDAVVSDTNVLEAGSVLVEFMRAEAACTAAHSLHGRRFGSRTVFAGYAPRDLYLQRYPR